MKNSSSPNNCCCRLEAVVSVDARGQLVLPKEVRDRAGIQPGQKLALICHQDKGQPCCLFLIRAEEFNQMARGVLGPMVKEIVTKTKE